VNQDDLNLEQKTQISSKESLKPNYSILFFPIFAFILALFMFLFALYFMSNENIDLGWYVFGADPGWNLLFSLFINTLFLVVAIILSILISRNLIRFNKFSKTLGNSEEDENQLKKSLSSTRTLAIAYIIAAALPTLMNIWLLFWGIFYYYRHLHPLGF
jgi:hypothetical protein